MVLGIIPARWGATRFPGKPLHPIAGRPLVQRVWERARAARELSEIVIATDDARIARAAEGFGARVMMTSPGHPSGTDRIAEAAAALGGDFSHVLNIQGDEPTVDPALLDRLAGAMLADPGLSMVTAACPLRDPADFENPHCVKVVVSQAGDALYFSRSAIPHGATAPLRHQGIYGYTRAFLAKFVRWKPSPLEQTERLEQLRALENGTRIRVLVTERESLGVDTPEDVARVERWISSSRDAA